MNSYHIPGNAIITVAGTVGVGKSTLTAALAERLGFQTSLEQVDHNPYLEKFYHDFERWSFHLQIYFRGALQGAEEDVRAGRRLRAGPLDL